MIDKYARNKELINEREQLLLQKKTAAIIGLGGLGGYIAEMLTRLGLGHLVLIDDDIVEPTNLNRQLFATSKTLGLYKTDAASVRLHEVDPETECTTHTVHLTQDNAHELLQNVDIVFDAVDNIPTRLVLESVCALLKLPLIHGSIGGLWGQVSVIYPGDNTLSQIYSGKNASGVEKRFGNPAFTPALVASIQTSEALKYLLGRPVTLRGKLLRIDLLNHEYFVIEIEG